MKALTGDDGRPKLRRYAHRTAFRDVPALSGSGDTAFGPKETVPVILMNPGKEKTAALTVQVRDANDGTVHTQTFENIRMSAGRTAAEAADMALPKFNDGLYSFAYPVSGGRKEQ